MKKVFIFLLAFILIGCTSSNKNEPKQEKNEVQTEEKITSDQKILVAYFTRVGNTDFPSDVDVSSSASLIQDGNTLIGNTEYIANIIVEQTGGDKFLIQTETKYPKDYDELVDQQQDEKAKNTRPQLSSHVDNMEDYDVIYLGFPNWWYDMPMPVYTFLEEYDFSQKIIIPFNTSGGSGFSDTINEIKELCPNATVLDGYTTVANSVEDNDDEIVKWIKSHSLR